MKKRSAAFLALLWALLAVPSAVKRFAAEKKDKTVEVCVSLAETRELAGDAALINFLERCRIVGVSSLAIESDVRGALPDLGFTYALVLEERPLKLPAGGNFPIGSYMVMPAAPDLYEQGLYFGRDLENAVKKGNSRFVLFDKRQKPYEQVADLARNFPRHAVKAHTLPPREALTLSAKSRLSRWTRAVEDRSCRFLYFRWDPRLTADENLAFLRDLRSRLRQKGYAFGPSADAAAVPFTEIPGRGLRLALAWLAAALTPLAALARVRKSSGPWAKTFAMALLFPVLGGLTVSFLLPDTVFVNGLESFRGVKAALLFPLLAAGFVIWDRETIRGLLDRKVSVGESLAVLGAGLFLWMMLDRSGNYSSLVGGTETRFREALESAFSARPRFKEFLIGHPLLILGIYLKDHSDEGSAGMTCARFCVWAGTVGLVSAANSFCHLHTPLSVTLLRTFHGAWLGALIGAALIQAVQWRRRSS